MCNMSFHPSIFKIGCEVTIFLFIMSVISTLISNFAKEKNQKGHLSRQCNAEILTAIWVWWCQLASSFASSSRVFSLDSHGLASSGYSFPVHISTSHGVILLTARWLSVPRPSISSSLQWLSSAFSYSTRMHVP